MTFEEILDQAIAMLQRRGRLTYRTLQRQFQLDDVALDDLKDELIYGQRLATDEDGRVLVWTGGTAVPPLTTPSTHQTGPLPAPVVTHPTQSLPPRPRRPPLKPSGASSRCCFVIWWAPRSFRRSLISRSYGRSCAPIIR